MSIQELPTNVRPQHPFRGLASGEEGVLGTSTQTPGRLLPLPLARRLRCTTYERWSETVLRRRPIRARGRGARRKDEGVSVRRDTY